MLLLCINTPTQTYASELMFHSLTTADGLSQTSINYIYQDSSDYIWIGTKNGLNTSSKILSIEFYNDNEIYMISKNYLLKYDMISCQYSIIYDLPEDDIFTSLTLYEDVIYLATECNGIYTYNINTGEINNEYKLYANGHRGPSHTINHIYIDDTGVYAGSTNGLYIFEKNGSQKHFTADSYDQYSLIDNYISYIMKDSSGLLWIGTFSGINTVDCNSRISYYNNFIIEQNMKTNIVMGTYEDVDEKLWLGGSNKEGLIKFNPKDSSLNLFKYSHLANSISDNTILSTEECIMKFDRDSIERCIINVVGNAIKFTNSCGKILVNIIDSPSVLTIEISDNGSGIPPEKIDGIFDRFSQVINSKREFSNGSGLGLTITKGLIELHGGDITVTSELGKGTTFTIILPKNI